MHPIRILGEASTEELSAVTCVTPRAVPMPTFNNCPHTFMTIQADRVATLSIDFNGTPVTMSFIARSTTHEPECIDIKVHHTHKWIRTEKDTTSPRRPLQKAIMFWGGCVRKYVQGTLLTVLVNEEHLKEEFKE